MLIFIEVAFFRQFLYICMMLVANEEFITIINKINDTRKLHRTENQRIVNLKFCKSELMIAFGYFCVYSVVCAIVVSPYNYRLPLNFYFKDPGLGELSFKSWLVNYLCQSFALICLALFFMPHFLLLLITMNHSCCVIDLAITTVEDLGRHLRDFGSKNARVDEKFIRKAMKDVVKSTNLVLDWQQTVNPLLSSIFCVELTIESSIICMCTYTLSKNISGSVFVFTEVVNCTLQLFIYCWMGSRVISRIRKLSRVIYEIDWRLMTPKQQKNLQFILMMSQKLKGFDGIFKEVSLESFKEVRSFISPSTS